MLIKQKILLNNDTPIYKDLNCEDLYIASDMSYISGVTSCENNLYVGDSILLLFDNSQDFKEYTIDEVENICRQGFILFDEKYKINSYINDDKTVYYFKHKDGSFCFGKEKDGYITFYINQLSREISTSKENKVISCPTVTWVENGYINVMGVETFVDFSMFAKSVYDENGRIKLNGDEWLEEEGVKVEIHGKYYDLHHYQPSERIFVSKFKINRKPLEGIGVDNIEVVKKRPYFLFGSESIQGNCCKEDLLNDNKELRTEKKCYLDEVWNEKENIWEEIHKEGKLIFRRQYVGKGLDRTNTYTVVCDAFPDRLYEVFEEWETNCMGNNIRLNLSDDNRSYSANTKIIAKQKDKKPTTFEVWGLYKNEDKLSTDNEKPYIIFGGKKVYVKGIDEKGNYTNEAVKSVIYNDKPYRLFFDRKNWGLNTKIDMDAYVDFPNYAHAFIVHEKVPSLFRVSENYNNAVHFPNYSVNEVNENNAKVSIISYPIEKTLFVEINGKEYPIYDLQVSLGNKMTNRFFVDIDEQEEYVMQVVEIKGSNELFCTFEGDETDSIANILYLNRDKYDFFLDTSFIEERLVTPIEWFTNKWSKVQEFLHLYVTENFIPFTIPIDNKIGLNLTQEDIVRRDYTDREFNKRLNRIVDMEKDVYYPKKKVKNNLLDVSQIQFFVHFRDRGDNNSFINENWTFNDTKEWNITQYYKKDMIDEKSYFQPSDLLCFLGFDDGDVYYQKQKIAKSFLRLSFYDSIDPKVQSLLGSSTVFLNEHELYLKYIKNTDYGKNFVKANTKNGFTDNFGRNSEFIGVSSEYVKEDNPKNITFKRDKNDKSLDYDDTRLSMKFTINNLYNSEESSEGFYLHIFKEYSTNYRPRRIYMKVEFSHAGKGKTLAMFCPMKGYKEKELINFGDFKKKYCINKTTEEEKNKSRYKGVPLDELYSSMYIPINVIYDEGSKQYVYYLDEGMNGNIEDSILRFNLYELKIKDES